MIGFQVTVENVGDAFLRHSVYGESVSCLLAQRHRNSFSELIKVHLTLICIITLLPLCYIYIVFDAYSFSLVNYF